MAPPSLLDALLPTYDHTTVERVVVAAPPDAVYDAVRTMDFLSVRSPLVTAAFTVREAPGRIIRWIGRRPAPPPPPTMRLAAMFDDPDESSEWVGLAERRPDELVFGAVGAVWKPRIEWKRVEPEGFAAFDEPGYAKIAAAFTTALGPDGSTTLSYEARTATTDDAASRRFGRYWRVVRPFVGVIMRAALRTAGDLAEHQQAEGRETHARG